MSFMNNDRDTALDNNASFAGIEVDVRPLLKLVYLWMSLGIFVSAIVAYFVTSSVMALPPEQIAQLSGWVLPLMILQFGLVIGIGWGINKISPTIATGLFFVYAASVGLTLGFLFPIYIGMGDGMAIVSAFFTTAGVFGTMTVVGYTTKVDLSKYSSFFMMALIGLIIASVVNIFLGSGMFSFIISVFGVLLFTALTAWDTQKIKRLAQQPEYQQYTDSTRRLAVLGALTLYLDFLNLFLFMLQIFAGRD